MAYDFKSVTVLVVEDSSTMAELIRNLLISFGIGRVEVAKDGTEGYAAYLKIRPDLIISDWLMSPMDGISMTKKIRNDTKSHNPFVPVILITAFSERPRIMQARDSGVTEILAKPFTVMDLYKRVEAIIEKPRQFVKSENFFDPDRRRHRDNKYEGSHKREKDEIAALGYAMPVNWLKYQWLEKQDPEKQSPEKKSIETLGIPIEIDFV